MNNPDKKEVNNEIVQELNQEEKKPTTGDKIGGALKGLGKGLVGAASKGFQWGKEQYEKMQESNEFKKEFKRQTYEYSVEGTSTSFRAFRDDEHSRLLVHIESEHISKTVRADSVLICTDDNSKRTVVAVNIKQAIAGEITVEGRIIPLSLFSILTKEFVKEKDPQVTYNVTQTMNITDSTVQGNIQQINDITTKLNDFESQLKAFKPSVFQKNHYQEAIKIYGSVKDSIIHGQKDSSVVKTFLDLILKLSSALFTIFSGIVS